VSAARRSAIFSWTITEICAVIPREIDADDSSPLESTSHMPLYEYLCKKCGHRFEEIKKFSDKQPKKCPECGGVIEQVISAPAVQFKGSGWYVTDYAKKSSSSTGTSSSSNSSDSEAGQKESRDSKESKDSKNSKDTKDRTESRESKKDDKAKSESSSKKQKKD
jgi:putative FmdB family regulatory protein